MSEKCAIDASSQHVAAKAAGGQGLLLSHWGAWPSWSLCLTCLNCCCTNCSNWNEHLMAFFHKLDSRLSTGWSLPLPAQFLGPTVLRQVSKRAKWTRRCDISRLKTILDCSERNVNHERLFHKNQTHHFWKPTTIAFVFVYSLKTHIHVWGGCFSGIFVWQQKSDQMDSIYRIRQREKLSLATEIWKPWQRMQRVLWFYFTSLTFVVLCLPWLENNFTEDLGSHASMTHPPSRLRTSYIKNHQNHADTGYFTQGLLTE